MTQDDSAAEEIQPSRMPYQVRIPGFNAEVEMGLGDVIKRATSLAGIRPCKPCSRRASNLNRLLVFRGRQSPPGALEIGARHE